jgi:hypothetical protein
MRLLAYVQAGRGAPRDAVLLGPRGNGKTVLLHEFRARGRQAGAGVLALTAAQVRTEGDLALQLLYKDPGRWGKGLVDIVARLLPGALNLKAPGATELGLVWQKLGPAEKNEHARAHLVQLLTARCQDKPLVVTIDEAHTLDLEVGCALLNLSQSVRDAGAPFLLILAGTPDLENHLRKMKATFWTRAEVLGIGRLSGAATREALIGPLGEHGVTMDEAALATVVAESQRYPYFIQLWGEALCAALLDSEPDGPARIGPATVDAARAAVELRQTIYYKDRHQEMKQRGLLHAARAVGNVFDARGTDKLDPPADLEQALEQALELDPPAAQDAVRQLCDLGYIWEAPPSPRPPGGPWRLPPQELGIPSLKQFVLDNAPPLPDAAPAPLPP